MFSKDGCTMGGVTVGVLKTDGITTKILTTDGFTMKRMKTI
jgi:hypothetical protein